MERLLKDLRFAARMLRRRPGTSLAAVVSMALGIGAVTVVFSFVYGVLLRPLPYPEPERLVMVWNQFLARDMPRVPSSGKEFEDHREHGLAFSDVTGAIGWYFNLTGGDRPERVKAARISAGAFDVLGAEPVIGRGYTREEQDRGERLAVLSHGLWQRSFDGDPGILEERILLDEVPYTVVGVLPEDFYFPPLETDLWVPLVPNPKIPRALRGVMVVARLAPGLSLAQAQAEIDSVARDFRERFPDLYTEESGWGIRLVPLEEEIEGEVRGSLVALFVAVFLVLAIACANVASLLLVQSAERRREVALRTSLGAGRGDVVRLLFTESVLLSLLGGALGTLLAVFATRALVRLEPGDLPRLSEVSVDAGALLFAFVLSLVTGLLFGLAPALSLARSRPNEVLQEASAGRATPGGFDRGARRALVVADLALALAILVGAGLALDSFQRMSRLDPGVETEDVVTAEIALSGATYGPPDARRGLYRRLLERYRELPQVEEAGWISLLPFEEAAFPMVPEVEGYSPPPGQPNPPVQWRSVSPEAFDVLGIPLVEGRLFDGRDHQDSARVALVDEATAERYWPGRSPLGRRIRLPDLPASDWMTVVGVVGHVEDQGPAAESLEQVYVPYLQFPTAVMGVVARARSDVGEVGGALARATWDVEPNQPVDRIQPLERLLAETMARPQFNSLLLGFFAVSALLLTAVGLYGVTAYSVARRSREFGVRMALGSGRGGIFRLVLAESGRTLALGLAAGLALTFLVLRGAAGALPAFLHRTTLFDWPVLAGAVVFLALVALAASALPTRRVVALDPVRAIRDE